jgi:hypothetical protein
MGQFKNYIVKELPFCDDNESIGIGIFDVEDDKVQEVKDKFYVLLEENFENISYLIYPRIKNRTITREYYPEYMVKENSK